MLTPDETNVANNICDLPLRIPPQKKLKISEDTNKKRM
jgi:hypothetical protein